MTGVVSICSSRGDQTEPVASAKPSTVVARRGRLVRPKPNLGPSSRSKQIQSLTQREGGLWSKRFDMALLPRNSIFTPAVFCKSTVCSSSEAQVSTERPIGGAVEQANPAADAGASSEVMDDVDQPHAVAGPPLGSLDEAPSYTQVSFRAAAMCSRLCQLV